ncbi:propanoyl-CoA acyltransferase [Desulfonema ishimotonii]|uniref:Propanoyl-CoA acyltransferase n=1 Tax=Desulfonema ishimotonii TaxID=45657 RepID=A0A401FTF6_9BACT|nr:propanoyl-CoA acyltransferase [Desulfonema ishimotonii]GBC60234.1 propanoyl-CoA acyltransferase [Desulfonema ishimotonii]
MRKVAVVGLGHTRFMSDSPKSQVEMLSEASMDAISASNLTSKDIQAIFCGNVLGDFSEGQGMIQSYLADDIGCFNVPASRFEGACASATMAIRDAYMWVASGFYDIVLAGGVEKATAMGTSLATRTFAMFHHARYEYPAGFTFPAFFAMLTHLYSGRYGVPLEKLKEQMAMISVQSHHYGAKNPKAQFQKEITAEQVLNGFTVTTPLQLLDCCPFSDGAAAIVLASEEAARRLTDRPVYIAGVGQASSGKLSAQHKYLPRLRAREISVKQAYDMAGVGPEDIDVCELHDCFSIASIIAAEGLGFAEFGKGGELWEKGETRIGGKIPINISGGLKSKGHPIGATGASQVCEIVRQLRGELADEERQVGGARVGLVDTLGGDGVIVNLILRRE